MKKHLFLLVLFTSPFFAFSQNWQLINSSKEYWFAGKDNSLKVIITDSVKYNGSDSIFYFPYTLGAVKWDGVNRAKINVNLRSPWWTGNRMVLRPDGSHIFFSAENDSIILWPAKALNDEWQMMKFPSGNYVMAKIISAAIESPSGITDSVKTMQLSVYNSNHIALPTHALNGKVIKTGKSTGLVSVYPFFSFLDNQAWFYEYHTEKYKLD
jgi:hypothetical protein